MLKRDGLDPAKLDLNALRAEYEKMSSQKTAALSEYNELSSKTKELERLTDTLVF